MGCTPRKAVTAVVALVIVVYIGVALRLTEETDKSEEYSEEVHSMASRIHKLEAEREMQEEMDRRARASRPPVPPQRLLLQLGTNVQRQSEWRQHTLKRSQEVCTVPFSPATT